MPPEDEPPPRDEEERPERDEDLPEDFLAAVFRAEDFFAAVRPPLDRVLDDFLAAVRPLDPRLDDDLLPDDFFAAVRPLDPRPDDDLLDDDLPLDDFFALDFFVAIRIFSPLKLNVHIRTFHSQSAKRHFGLRVHFVSRNDSVRATEMCPLNMSSSQRKIHPERSEGPMNLVGSA